MVPSPPLCLPWFWLGGLEKAKNRVTKWNNPPIPVFVGGPGKFLEQTSPATEGGGVGMVWVVAPPDPTPTSTLTPAQLDGAELGWADLAANPPSKTAILPFR